MRIRRQKASQFVQVAPCNRRLPLLLILSIILWVATHTITASQSNSAGYLSTPAPVIVTQSLTKTLNRHFNKPFFITASLSHPKNRKPLLSTDGTATQKRSASKRYFDQLGFQLTHFWVRVKQSIFR